ncbi:MAG: hypothetical protein ACREC6_04050 [Hyphomicrobiaceae bacterium]
MLAISIVFSYAARLEWFTGVEDKSRIQVAAAQYDVGRILNDLKAQVDKERRRLAEEADSVPDYKAWLTKMESLVKVSVSKPAQAAIVNSLEEKRTDETAAQQERVRIEEDIRNTQNRIKTVERDIGDLKARTEEPDTSEPNGQIDGLTAKMKAEEEGIGPSGIKGKGQEFFRLEANRDRRVRERDRIVAAAYEARRKLVARQQELVQLQAEEQKLLGDAMRSGVSQQDLETAVTLQTLRKLEAGLPNIAQTLRNDLTALKAGFHVETYRFAVGTCKKLLPLKALPELRSDLKDLHCDVPALAQPEKAAADFQAIEERFREQCSRPPAIAVPAAHPDTNLRVRIEAIDRAMGQAFSAVDDCVDKSGLTALPYHRDAIAKLRGRVSDLQHVRTTGVDYLTFSFAQLHKGTTPALMAISVAGVIDLLVLALTFLGILLGRTEEWVEYPRVSSAEAAAMGSGVKSCIRFSSITATTSPSGICICW